MTFYYTRYRAREAMRARTRRMGAGRYRFQRGYRFYGQFYNRTRGGTMNYMRARAQALQAPRARGQVGGGNR